MCESVGHRADKMEERISDLEDRQGFRNGSGGKGETFRK